MDIIAKIEKLKSDRGWTDYELAQQAIVTQSTIASMKARNSPPKLETLQAICNAFGITLAQFFLEDEKIEVLSEQEVNIHPLSGWLYIFGHSPNKTGARTSASFLLTCQSCIVYLPPVNGSLGSNILN